MIRIARAEDLTRINSIYNQAVDEGFCTAHTKPVDMSYRRNWYEKHGPKYPVFVYTGRVNEEEPAVWGWLSVSPYRAGRQALEEVAEVSYYVGRQRRQEGIATDLMSHALEELQKKSFRIVVAILVSGNTASINLLEKFGFREMGRIPDALRYGNEYRDHLYMGRPL